MTLRNLIKRAILDLYALDKGKELDNKMIEIVNLVKFPEKERDVLLDFDNLYYSFMSFDNIAKEVILNKKSKFLKGKKIEAQKLDYILRSFKYFLSERIINEVPNNWESNLLVAVGHNDATPFKRKNLMGHLALVD